MSTQSDFLYVRASGIRSHSETTTSQVISKNYEDMHFIIFSYIYALYMQIVLRVWSLLDI